MRRHQGVVRGLLRRLCAGDAALADDLAQETFLLAWRKLPAFRFESRLSTWLYRIALNAWKSDRRRPKELALPDDEAAMPADESAPLPDVIARVDLERAFALLSDGERAAIAACYGADLSHDEAAKALGLPLGTVKTHVNRAKAKLRARLADPERKEGP